ncbi:enoyl-CoA hydratase/isomerase family protein [Halalkalibacter kiskunsagensis]|uniref:Ethylmalonyl-CoA decarboxylase n=1 Tax=Halalkalibacter kiskunsagensis TaxID=1548599 RepID=A0ABV6KJI9_9BACI
MESVQIKNYGTGVTLIQIDRKEIRNAINEQVMDELNQALTLAERDASCIVVISGSGERAFCSGGDLSVFQYLKTEKQAKEMLLKMGAILERLAFFPKVTVAALNGTAVGGGSELATACDLRIAAPHVKLGFVQGELGITTGWGGSSLLFERVTNQIALDMLLSARMYSTDELYKQGFVHKVIYNASFLEGVIEYLESYFLQNKGVLQAYKARLLDQLDRPNIHRNIQNEIKDCAKLWETDVHHEAVRAFLNRS